MVKRSRRCTSALARDNDAGVQVARTYQRRWLRADLFAGVTIFALLVPQGMAYGELAGVAPVVGLYTAIGALVGAAVFGSSRRLLFGPESSSALLVAATVAPLAAGGDPARFAALASLLALLIGCVALAAGLARFGFLADFVSRPILLGYIAGVSLMMITGQLGKLFGIPVTNEQFFPDDRGARFTPGSNAYADARNRAGPACFPACPSPFRSTRSRQHDRGRHHDAYFSPDGSEEIRDRVVGTIPSGPPTVGPA